MADVVRIVSAHHTAVILRVQLGRITGNTGYVTLDSVFITFWLEIESNRERIFIHDCYNSSKSPIRTPDSFVYVPHQFLLTAPTQQLIIRRHFVIQNKQALQSWQSS